jgi:hypothetical protein
MTLPPILREKKPKLNKRGEMCKVDALLIPKNNKYFKIIICISLQQTLPLERHRLRWEDNIKIYLQ